LIVRTTVVTPDISKFTKYVPGRGVENCITTTAAPETMYW
jgi:hypothetical protein